MVKPEQGQSYASHTLKICMIIMVESGIEIIKLQVDTVYIYRW